MKGNLHSACLLLIVFPVLIIGFVDLVGASEDYDSNHDSNYDSNYDFLMFEYTMPGGANAPAIEYPAWGYISCPYTFSTMYEIPSEMSTNNLTMVFYWDCWGNRSDYDYLVLNDPNRSEWRCNHAWEKAGLYGFSVGIFEESGDSYPIPVSVSYWMSIEIKDEEKAEINVPTFFMRDEKEGFDGIESEHIYNRSVSNSIDSSVKSYENKSYYCVYEKDHYAFSALINASNPSTQVENDEKIWAEFKWDDGSSDSTKRDALGKMHNYTHEWDEPGVKNIRVWAVKRDLYNGSNNIYSAYNNCTVLVIKDPKNFVNTPNPYISSLLEPFSNLHTCGIFLVATGLMILFFTYTKNHVPVEISLFGLKPLRLKSVDSFAGIFAFVAGMYLHFVFGRCPWDIPVVGNSDLLKWLADAYFGVLYYENVTNQFFGIPYLSVLLGLVSVLALSLLTYLVGGPVFKGELKSAKRPGEKVSSAPVQPEPDPHPVEKRMHPEELAALIEKEKDPVILRQLYYIRFRYLGDPLEKAASTLGISVGKALNWQETWNESGYEGFRTGRKGENVSLQELTALIENEKDARVLKALYFIRLRSLENSTETAASRLGISEESGQRAESAWEEKGYEGLRDTEIEGREG